jgi:steroid 5-alpha reductase family enzyme
MADMSDFLRLSALSLLLLAVLQAATFVWSRRAGKYAVVDNVWGLGLGLVAVLGALVGVGDLPRRLLLALVLGAWGLRLTVHLLRRSSGAPEDPRYAAIAQGRSPLHMALRVFALQGFLQWFISLPVQVSASTGPVRGVAWALVVLGAVLAVVGIAFESIGDRQLAAFRADPANKGRILDTGLWAWSRHPNYFGDACVWTGAWLVAAAVWPGVLTILSPVAMVYVLVVLSGGRLLEKHMAGRPGYAEYQARTSFFLPRPPKR